MAREGKVGVKLETGSATSELKKLVTATGLLQKSFDKSNVSAKKTIKILQDIQKQERATINAKKALIQATIREKSARTSSLKALESLRLETARQKKETQLLTTAKVALTNQNIRVKTTEEALKAARIEGVQALSKQREANTALINKRKEMLGQDEKILTSSKGVTNSFGLMTKALGTLGVTIGAGFIARKSIDTITDFEFSMARVKAITRATEIEFTNLSNTARDLGATTQFTASQAAQGMKYLGLVGLNTNEIIASTPAVLNLATAAAIDMGSAADIIAKTMTSFNIEANNTNQITDILVQTMTNANTDVLQFGQALKFVGPVAQSANISLKATAAAVGAISNSGIQASIAGTGLRRVIQGLLNPTKKAVKAFNLMGLSVDDVNPQLVSFEDIIRRLASAGLGQLPTLAFEAFGLRGAPVVQALVNNIDDFEKLLDLNKEAIGRGQEVSDVLNNTLKIALRRVTSALQEAALSAGDSGLLGVLKSIVNTTASVIRSLAGIASSTEQASKKIQFITAVIKTLTMYLAGKTIVKMGLLTTELLGVGTAAKTATVAIGALTQAQALAAEKAAAAAVASKAASIAMVGGITAAAGGALFLVPAIIDLFKYYRNLRKETADYGEEATLFASTMEEVGGAFDSAGGSLGWFEDRLKDIAFDEFKTKVEDTNTVLKDMGLALASFMEGDRLPKALATYSSEVAEAQNKVDKLNKATNVGTGVLGVHIGAAIEAQGAYKDLKDAIDKATDPTYAQWKAQTDDMEGAQKQAYLLAGEIQNLSEDVKGIPSIASRLFGDKKVTADSIFDIGGIARYVKALKGIPGLEFEVDAPPTVEEQDVADKVKRTQALLTLEKVKTKYDISYKAQEEIKKLREQQKEVLKVLKDEGMVEEINKAYDMAIKSITDKVEKKLDSASKKLETQRTRLLKKINKIILPEDVFKKQDIAKTAAEALKVGIDAEKVATYKRIALRELDEKDLKEYTNNMIAEFKLQERAGAISKGVAIEGLRTLLPELTKGSDLWLKVTEAIKKYNEAMDKDVEKKKKDRIGWINEALADIQAEFETSKFEILSGEDMELYRSFLVELQSSADITAKQYKKIQRVIDGLRDSTNLAKEATQEWTKDIENGFVKAIMGAENFADAMSNVISKMAEFLIQQALFGGGGLAEGKIGGLLGSFFGTGKANGGPVSKNRAYVVGERQPELFVPSTAGTIIPQMGMGTYAPTIQVSVNVETQGDLDDEQAQRVGNIVAGIIEAKQAKSIARERRSGGMLNRPYSGVSL